MSLTTTLVFAIGPAVAKALLSQLLKDKPILSDLAPDLLDWLKDKAKAERRAAARQISAIGEEVAAKLRPIIAEARLPDNELAAVLNEFTATLDEDDVDAARLVGARLDRVRLARGMLRARPEATTLLSADGAALYDRLVREASAQMTALAAEFAGYASLRDAALLQDHEQLLEAVLALLRRPDEERARFEAKYREVIQRELNKLELFGVRRLTAAAKRQRLNVAYVTVEVDQAMRAAPDQRNDDVALLRQLLDESARSLEQHEASERRTSPINTVLASRRRIIIRGEAGSGKTTLLQWIAVNAATPDGFSGSLQLWNNTVPFFIRLRQVAEQGFPAPEQYIALIAPHVAGSRPRNGWEHEQLENGRAVLLIDGVDELPKGKREAFLEQLKDLVRDFPQARYLITSRPAAVNERAWPEWNEWTQEEGFAEVAIQPMSNTAVDEFIDHWHRAYAAGTTDQDEKDDLLSAPTHLKKLLPQRTGLRRLASNPLLCAMICALHYEKRHQLPSERIKLYEECVDMLLVQRDAGRGISLADYPDLGTKQKQALLQDLAFRMMRGGESELPIETVEAQFESYLPRLGVDVEMTRRLRAYFVERSAILREPVQGQIDFAHRTFQEFFTAQAIAKSGELGFLQKNLNDDQWQETVVLAAGLLQTKQSERLLRALLAKAQSSAKTVAAIARRRRLRALALACLETALDINPALRHEILEAAQELFPPYRPEDQRAIAAAGEHAIPYLLRERQPNIAAMAACIRTLALIGGEKALQAIESYKDVDHDAVREAIDAAWPSFDHGEYARRLLKDRRAIRISDAALLPMLAELPQLQTLDLSFTPLSDLSPLATLPQLQQLDLSGMRVRDLSGLAELAQLQRLDLSYTQVNDLSGLVGLAQLQTLNLSFTQVSDLSLLAALPQLQQLSLSRVQVSDLSLLAALPQLQQLDLSRTQMSDLSLLAALPQLQTLHLSVTAASDLSLLAALPQLQTLHLSVTAVSDWSFLAHLPQLQGLDLSGAQVSDWSFLTQVPQLQKLYLVNTPMNDWSLLAHLPQLQMLLLSEMQVRDLNPLATLSQLQTLYLVNMQIGDLSFLAHLPQLQTLFLTGTQVNDLSFLAHLPQLQTLYLINTQVRDLSPLAGLAQLQQLDLSDTQVSDLSLLAQLPNLERLVL